MEHIVTLQLKARKKIIRFIDQMVPPYRQLNNDEMRLCDKAMKVLCGKNERKNEKTAA
ncbi:MAG: hypothetical protein WA144_13705 [Candidatus Methanoperedens sp.]